MGTKENPGAYDCYDKALPDEPMFTILARDPHFCEFVTEWATRRQFMINCGERPQEDQRAVSEAYNVAIEGARWRRNNNGKWRL